MPYLVDGNNLLGVMTGRRPDGDGGRKALIQLLNDYARKKGSKIAIVFDGPPVAGYNKTMHYGPVTATFAGPESDADSVIKRRVKQSRHPKELIVISSDSAVYQFARTHGAQARKSQTLYQDMISLQAGNDQQQVERNLSGSEIDEWLDYFGLEEEN